MTPGAAGADITVTFFFIPVSVVMAAGGGTGCTAGSAEVESSAKEFFHTFIGLAFCPSQDLDSGILKRCHGSNANTAADQDACAFLLQGNRQGAEWPLPLVSTISEEMISSSIVS